MEILVLIISILSILFTFMGLLRRQEWWIRIFDFPRVQVAVLLVVSLGFSLSGLPDWRFWDYLLAAVLLLALGYQLYKIFPYTPFSKRQVPAADTQDPERVLSIMVSNVLMTNKKTGKLLALAEKMRPDLLLTLETNSWWEDQLRPLEEAYPHTIKVPMDNLYGMHLYSKLPIKEHSVNYLITEGIPSIDAQIRLRCGKDVRLFCLHPEPPSPTESETSTPRDAELLMVGKKVSNSSEPILICGDLNDVAWSNTTRLFQKISGLRDPRVGRGFFNTFHTRYPFFRWPLDHIFLSEHFKLIRYKRLPHIGSDHFPIFTAIYFSETVAKAEHLPEAEAEDHKRATKKIKKADPLREML
ncbi:endonuclease/exonuclease/phosphatase family protein [Robiginitalea sp. IMCC44478]|uniref:endonuclease/exonuclease/phosphatase family protein n=1 Tax=Robiginitalea sp. IMCC44478 TaxID=3459122 RepID=UPI004041555A